MPQSRPKRAKAADSPAKVALVTGASRGIGAELARQFAKGGYDLVLVARNAQQLRELAAGLKQEFGRAVTVMAADLGQPGAPRALFEQLAQKGIAIEVLVNNVGLLSHGEFTDIPLPDYLRLINLNIAVLTALTHLFLAPMRQRGSGRILNIASLSAFQPVPQLAVYAASKSYVVSLTEALYEELKGTGVTITAICPGFVDTDMVGDNNFQLPEVLLISPQRVAKEAYAACMKGVAVHVPGMSSRISARITDLQPRTVRRLYAALLSRLFLQTEKR